MLSEGTVSSLPESLPPSRSEPQEAHAPGLGSFILNSASYRLVRSLAKGLHRECRGLGEPPARASCLGDGTAQRRQGMAENAQVWITAKIKLSG